MKFLSLLLLASQLAFGQSADFGGSGNAVTLQGRVLSATAPTSNQVVMWNSTSRRWAPQAVTAGGGGTVTSIIGGTGLTGGTITTTGSLAVDVGTGASKIVQMTAAAFLPSVDGNLLFNVNATRIGTRSISTSAPSDNQFLTWNANASQWQPISTVLSGTIGTMASTTGVNGQSFFNTTYTAWFDWVSSRWWPRANPDPRYGFVLAHEEFTGTDRIGVLDWNTNSGTVTTTSANLLNPGLYLLRQATASAVANIRSDLAAWQFGTADFFAEAAIIVPTLATVSEDFSFAFGWNDNSAFSANSTCTDGAYFTLNRAVNGANLIANTASNTTTTTTNTSTAVTAGTEIRLGIFVSTTNSNVTFYANGTLIATHTTNIPTGAGRQTGIAFKLDKTAGSSNSDIYLDYFDGWGFFSTARVP